MTSTLACLSFGSIWIYPDLVRAVLFGFFAAVNDFIHRPWVVLWTCLGLTFTSFIMDGTALRMWSLNREFQHLSAESVTLEKEVATLDGKIRQATDPTFMEREARDRFDLVSEGDLVFVFADDE